MPSNASEKCRQCSKLSLELALQKHGPKGTDCWEGEPCHKRRTYYRYRDRYNHQRRQRYKVETGDSTQTEVILPPAIPAAVLFLYRERVDAPLHAIGAELWLGQEKVSMLQPMHCLGLTSKQVSVYLQEILQAFSIKTEVPISKFAAQVELHPSNCSIKPCPLHPE